jgi:hypothetical protein
VKARPKKKLVGLHVAHMRDVTLTPAQLAAVARRFAGRRKGVIQKWLSPSQAEECWRIHELQAARRELRTCYSQGVRPLDYYCYKQVKRSARKSTKRWDYAWHYNCGFREHIAKPIQESWEYQSRVKYSVEVSHSQTKVEYSSSRPACSYDTLSVTLTWDLLRHRWQWVGGMLTISRKTDAGKRNYPCWWFEQRNGQVGLVVKQGWILNWNYHVATKPGVTLEEARAKKSRIIALAKKRAAEAEALRIQCLRERAERQKIYLAQVAEEKRIKPFLDYIPPKGWVNRHMSLMAGLIAT